MMGYVPFPNADELLLDALENETAENYGPFVDGCFNSEGAGVSGNVAGTCIEALGRLRARKAEPVVVRFALDKKQDDWVRYCAINALGELGSDASVDALISLFDDTTLNAWPWRRSRNDCVAEALRRISGFDLGADGRAWKDWRRGHH